MGTKKPNLSRLIDFQQLLFSFRAIDRSLRLPGQKGRLENDVEHSYNLAMTGWFLASYFPHLDRDAIIRIALVHDLVEVYAGDTYIFDKDATRHASKAEREQAALEKLHSEWPDFPEMIETLTHYELKDSEEAKFVYALDKLTPPMLNIIGKGENWHAEGITLNDVKKAKVDKIALSPEIQAYYLQLIGVLEQHPEFFPKTK